MEMVSCTQVLSCDGKSSLVNWLRSFELGVSEVMPSLLTAGWIVSRLKVLNVDVRTSLWFIAKERMVGFVNHIKVATFLLIVEATCSLSSRRWVEAHACGARRHARWKSQRGRLSVRQACLVASLILFIVWWAIMLFFQLLLQPCNPFRAYIRNHLLKSSELLVLLMIFYDLGRVFQLCLEGFELLLEFRVIDLLFKFTLVWLRVCFIISLIILHL